MRLAILLCVTVCAAFPAEALDLSQRPESCERIATAQYDNCSIANIFRCPGEQAAFWIETLDADSILTIETRNADHGSQSIVFVGQDFSMRLVQSKAHPRDTILNGSAADTIVGELDMFGMVRPITGETRYSHAGETVVLAGETFARISFVGTVELPPPMPETVGDGTFLYSERLDLLVEEVVRADVGGVIDASQLAHLALTGQDGFGDETPGYGCGELSGLPLLETEAPA
ncbi:MAG: hypothetical protein MUE52_21165 [Tabrizicola sp.]|jgi:hypothetical protein|nr:hypothetical protein [Tabrizicola sp.]